MDLKLDWTQFTRRIFVNVNPKTLFDLWTIPENIEKGFLERADFFREDELVPKKGTVMAGDTYKWKWFGWDSIAEGVILEIVEKECLRFDFGVAGNVEVKFEAADYGMTQLILTQSDIPTDEGSMRNYFYGCTNGWSFWMINCKLFAEHGITINDKRCPLPQDIMPELVNA